MRFMRLILLAVFSAFLSGCLSLAEPMVIYNNKAHPRQDTSVFAVQNFSENEDGSARGRIQRVDGKSIRDRTSLTDQVPAWVRVLPGAHDFEIVYGKSNGQFMIKTITVMDMHAKHVYVAHVIDQGMSYKVDVEDTGENSTFKQHIRKGMTSKYEDFTARF